MNTLEEWLIAHHAAHLARRAAVSEAVQPEAPPVQLDAPRPDERCPDEDEANALTANVTIPEPGSAVPLVEVPLA